jgi:hypothetical protein
MSLGLTFRNVSPAVCGLSGYPRLSFFSAEPLVLGSAGGHSAGPPEPGGEAASAAGTG